MLGAEINPIDSTPFAVPLSTGHTGPAARLLMPQATVERHSVLRLSAARNTELFGSKGH